MKVLFLCSGNSCRTQMAEAIVNHDRDLGWQAYSAGTRPTGFVHPLALQVLNELGIQHEGYSKSVDEFRSMAFDLVITVCDSAAEECPVWLGAGKRLHLGFPDPAKFRGSDEERVNEFRFIRDQMMIRIPEALKNYPAGL